MPVEPVAIQFTVFCHPEPQGSSRAWMNKKTGRAIVTSDNRKLKPFRQEVTCTARAVLEQQGIAEPMFGKHIPVRLVIDCFFQRPVSISRKRQAHVVKPDWDKLARSVSDSLTGVLYLDDAQIVEGSLRKHYGVPERVIVCCEAV